MPAIVPPAPNIQDVTDVAWNQFFELVRKMINSPNFYAQPSDPGSAGVPSGTWSIWKNTTSGVVKLWANDGGTMKSVTIT